VKLLCEFVELRGWLRLEKSWSVIASEPDAVVDTSRNETDSSELLRKAAMIMAFHSTALRQALDL
jgi:hypothetical protein